MSTLDLINAIQAGDSVGIEQQFDEAMTSRIAERLDDMRAYVAKNMFNEDVDVYDYEDIITEADIEAFMQTEEFEQLDELSKKTLGSYVTKAAHNMAVNHGARMTKSAEADEVDRFMNRNIPGGMQPKYKAVDDMKKTLGADNKSIMDLHFKIGKRAKGIDTAVKKLTKEDVEAFMQTEEFEQLDELSKKTLGSYVNKSSDDRSRIHAYDLPNQEKLHSDLYKARKADKSLKNHLTPAIDKVENDLDKTRKKLHNRRVGINRAVSRLTKEDIDHLEENRVPAGIKLFHHDKEGKESYSIHFSAQDAQREEKRRKKMGHKVVAHSLVYGQGEKPGTYDEGERVNH